MSVHDDLGTRMKEYEKRNQYYLQKRTPVAIRVDMRAGHTFTRGFKRPSDYIFMKSMQETAKYMCENMGNAKFAYVQSDEITIILTDYDTLETDCWFNYRTDKLCSISASMATMAFNKYFEENVTNEVLEYKMVPHCVEIQQEIKEYHNTLIAALDKGAMFDARCFNIPKEEVTNLIYWRQLDASRNSIQMVGQANFSHNELQNKSCNDIQDMLMLQKNINWNDFPTYQKRGSCVVKSDEKETITEDNIGTKMTIRSKWIIDKEMPILKGKDRAYIDKLVYVGE